ncbi:hypothetical protein Q7P37_003321 [Cladosporium fusiforme]
MDVATMARRAGLEETTMAHGVVKPEQGQNTHSEPTTSHRKEPLPNAPPTTNQTGSERAVRKRPRYPAADRRVGVGLPLDYTSSTSLDPQFADIARAKSSTQRRAILARILLILSCTYFGPHPHALSALMKSRSHMQRREGGRERHGAVHTHERRGRLPFEMAFSGPAVPDEEDKEGLVCISVHHLTLRACRAKRARARWGGQLSSLGLVDQPGQPLRWHHTRYRNTQLLSLIGARGARSFAPVFGTPSILATSTGDAPLLSAGSVRRPPGREAKEPRGRDDCFFSSQSRQPRIPPASGVTFFQPGV